ncbi:MAG: HAMP domain-containing sensor histidine kinase [Chitinophagales bacterium]
MKQWATLIQDHSISDPEKITDAAFKIKTTGEQALRLVDEFLSLRQIQEQKLDYFIATHDIVPFLRQIVNEFMPIAHGRKLTLEANIPEKQVAVNYDAIKLRQVFDNILDNAIKYTKEGGIKVLFKEDEDSVTVSVKDTGPGIKEDLLEKLFTEFQRDKDSKKLIKGTGLGLFIAKKIIKGHKGDIWAESEGENKGSTFFVRLPKP